MKVVVQVVMQVVVQVLLWRLFCKFYEGYENCEKFCCIPDLSPYNHASPAAHKYRAFSLQLLCQAVHKHSSHPSFCAKLHVVHGHGVFTPISARTWKLGEHIWIHRSMQSLRMMTECDNLPLKKKQWLTYTSIWSTRSIGESAPKKSYNNALQHLKIQENFIYEQEFYLFQVYHILSSTTYQREEVLTYYNCSWRDKRA